MIKRHLETDLMQMLKQFPCVAILGPRQTGKTTLVKSLAKKIKKDTLYLDLEKPSDKLKLQDAESFLSYHKDKCIIIDEIQYMPELFNLLRALIDEKRKPARFIVTGSASPALVKGVSESLAGRVAYTELTPIGLHELSKSFAINKHWFRGGFPDALTSKTDIKSKQWLAIFLKSYIERDLNQLFNITLTTSLLRNFWTMLSYNSASPWNAENYARALGVTGPTVNRYLDYLEGAFLIRRLQPWFANINRRLVKSPKIYIRDSGLLHRLANIETMDELKGNSIIGASWEGYVIEQIAQVVPPSITLFYYRTQDGAEVDLLLVKKNKVVSCIEIKVSKTASPSKGFYESIKVLKSSKNYIISPDSDLYPLHENVWMCSLKTFIQTELVKI